MGRLFLLAVAAATTARADLTPAPTPTLTPTPTEEPQPTPTEGPQPTPTEGTPPTPTPTNSACDPGFACPQWDQPVCGSDGITYPTDCALTVAQCTNSALFAVSDGACLSPTPSPACETGFTCSTDQYNPVCGSNGVTYANSCDFFVAQCEDPSLQVRMNGVCFPRIAPMPISPPKPQCDDGFVCQSVRDPVCGSNGKTYNNQCELTVAQCNDESLTIAAGGPCTSNTFDCSASCEASQDFVCGSDGKTYDNECFLQFAKYCSPGDVSLVVSSKGDCTAQVGGQVPAGTTTANGWASGIKTPTPTTVQGSTGTSCDDIVCTREKKPVCGSNGVTYSNNCQLTIAQCSDASIKRASSGECTSATKSASVSKEANDGSVHGNNGISSASRQPSSSSTTDGPTSSSTPTSVSASSTESSPSSSSRIGATASSSSSTAGSTSSSSSPKVGSSSPTVSSSLVSSSSSIGSSSSSGSSSSIGSTSAIDTTPSSTSSVSAAPSAHSGAISLVLSLLAALLGS